MKKLKKAKWNPKMFLRTIINSRKGANKIRFKRLHQDVGNKFADYSRKALDGKLVLYKQKWTYSKTKTTTDGYFLYHQYDNTILVSKLRAEIIKANGGEIQMVCPICGFREPVDLDHYAPRQLFPELSVHPYNLIPMCHECNNGKKVKWINPKGQRLIFNAYFDEITDKPLFDINIVIGAEGLPSISIKLKVYPSPIEESLRIAQSSLEETDCIDGIQDEMNKRLGKMLIGYVKEKLRFPGTFDDYWSFKKDSLGDMISEIDDVNDIDRIIYEQVLTDATIYNWIKNS